MRTKTKIALAAGAAGLIALAGFTGLASAHMQGRQGQAMGQMMGLGHGGYHGMMGGMAERYDANKDGKISQEEIDQNRTAWLGEFDLDKNGTLSLAEFEKLWLKARRERMVREFQQFDRDGNGEVTLDEYKVPMAHVVAEMDRNGDGLLGTDDRKPMGPMQRRKMHDGPASGDDD